MFQESWDSSAVTINVGGINTKPLPVQIHSWATVQERENYKIWLISSQLCKSRMLLKHPPILRLTKKKKPTFPFALSAILFCVLFTSLGTPPTHPPIIIVPLIVWPDFQHLHARGQNRNSGYGHQPTASDIHSTLMPHSPFPRPHQR